MARLWLLTDNYPFGDGETFITAELPYLLAQGVVIHIVPTARGALGRGVPARKMLPGVVVRTDIAQALAQARSAGVRGHMRLIKGINLRRAGPLKHAAAELYRAGRAGPKAAGRNMQRLFQAVMHAAMLAGVMCAVDDAPAPADGIYAYWLGASALGMRWAYPALKLVARAHGHDLFAARHAGHYLPMQTAQVAALDALYCISDDGAAYARAHLGHILRDILMMPLGTPATARRARPSSDGALRVVSCARVAPVKDLDLWLGALRLVTTPVVWTHFGDGPDKARLMHASKRLPAHVQVRWAGAIAPDTVLARLTAEPFDLFVNTSRHEGRPVSIMEALSVGLPVRATRVGGTAELLPKNWLWSRQEGAAGIACSLDVFAQLSERERLAQGQLALTQWGHHANADVVYPPFARHIIQACGLATIPL